MLLALPESFRHTLTLLASLFAAGLSPTLVDSLTLFSRHVPASVPLVRQRLLSVLSMLLAGEPFRHVENAVYPRKVDAPIVTNGQPVEEDQVRVCSLLCTLWFIETR